MAKFTNFEQLREYLYDECEFLVERLIDSYEDLTEFDKASYIGQIRAYNDILSEIRQSLKHDEVE